MPRFLRFTDRTGGRWRVYEFSIFAGVTRYDPPGGQSSQYRGFAPDPADGRPRRRYMMFKDANRGTDPDSLQLQFDLADVDYRDDPAHPSRGRS